MQYLKRESFSKEKKWHNRRDLQTVDANVVISYTQVV